MQGPFQTNSNNVSVMDLGHSHKGRRGVSGNVADSTGQCQLYNFSGSRDRLASELIEINAMFFLTISELHQAMLDKLLRIPSNFMAAAECLVKVPDCGDNPEHWAETLTLHVQTLGFSCGPVVEIARLHNRREQGAEIVDAIRMIENALPGYLETAARGRAGVAALADAATSFGSASSTLEKNLGELRATVGLSITRANSLVVLPRSPSRCP